MIKSCLSSLVLILDYRWQEIGLRRFASFSNLFSLGDNHLIVLKYMFYRMILSTFFIHSFFYTSTISPEPQEYYTIKGKITLNNKVLSSASVALLGTNKISLSDKDGNYFFQFVARGKYTIQVLHPRAKLKKLKIRVKNHFILNISLSKKKFYIAKKVLPKLKFNPSSRSSEKNDVLRLSPSVLGYSPNYFTFLPSIAKGATVFEMPIVRGQNPALNSYEVDGLIIDSPFHALGLFQSIDMRHIDEVEVFRGVFPLGNRDAQGASLIRYKLPDASSAENSGEFELGLFNINGQVQYHAGNNLSGSLALRRSHPDLLYNYVADDFGRSEISSYFFDYMGKVNYQLSSYQKIQVIYVGLSNPLESPVNNI